MRRKSPRDLVVRRGYGSRSATNPRAGSLSSACTFRPCLSRALDVDWLTIAGRDGLLVFSRNKRMLEVPHERAAIVKENVGVVFLTNGQESPARMLRLLLNKWDLLNFLDDHEPRPLASFLSPNGRLTTLFRNFQL